MRLLQAILISIVSIGLYVLATWFVQLGFNPAEWEPHGRAFWLFGLFWCVYFSTLFVDAYK